MRWRCSAKASARPEEVADPGEKWVFIRATRLTKALKGDARFHDFGWRDDMGGDEAMLDAMKKWRSADGASAGGFLAPPRKSR